MKYSVFMDVLEANTDLKEEPPYFLFFEGPFVLHFQKMVQIAIVAVLHYDIEGVIFDEWLLVADYEGMY